MPAKKAPKKSKPEPPPQAKEKSSSGKDTEDNIQIGMEEDMHALCTAVKFGRKLLSPPDGILVYYVALVNTDGVKAVSRGMTNIAQLFAVDKLPSASAVVETMATVTVVNPLLSQVQALMEDSARLLSIGVPPAMDDVRSRIAMSQSDVGAVDALIGSGLVAAPLPGAEGVETAIDGDAVVDE